MERPPSRLDRHSIGRSFNRSTATPRKPLGDASSRANASVSPPPVKPRHNHHDQEQIPPKHPLPKRPLPHNESIVPQAKLEVRRGASPGPKRISEIVNEAAATTTVKGGDAADGAKRDSVASKASTNTSTASPGRRKRHIGPWQLGRTIGKGGCSRVRIVRHAVTGQQGAAKIISKSDAENLRAQSLANLIVATAGDKGSVAGEKVMPYGLEREIVIMKLLRHPNIVQLFDVWENRNEIYLIVEYVEGGELFSYIEESGGLHEIQVVYLFRQIIGALMYCHRLSIYHRDLKPENILLDKQTWQVKLVDFGMAALQPEKRFLSTPCGSPHYAAPEVIFYGEYDGGKADVWSCGVVLYVMLTGDTPFYWNGGSTKRLFNAIARADYVLPTHLSKEAKDLISRILVPDPGRRMSIEDIWNHPFLHKYDDEFPADDWAYLEHWSNPRPQSGTWSVKNIEDIDREILRNMRTLWHSERESRLIQKLLNEDLNQEKYFYAALSQHRDEQLENFLEPSDFGYSASDRHHLTPHNRPGRPPVPPEKAKRSQSQFSILNDEHLYSKPSLGERQPSVSSYDPYRASKNPVVDNGQGGYVNVTVHRRTSNESGRNRTGAGPTQRYPSSLRIEAVKRSSQRGGSVASRNSRASLSARGASPRPGGYYVRHSHSRSRSSNAIGSVTSMPRSLVRYYAQHGRPGSRNSNGSSVKSTAQVIARPNSSYRRGVSFTHLRKGSQASATPSLPESTGTAQGASHRRAEQASRLHSQSNLRRRDPVPIPQATDAVVSRKENCLSGGGARLKVRRPKTPTHYIDTEARKVSTELEKACEEAFFRSSVGSSVRTDATTVAACAYETPPSSVSKRSTGARYDSSVASRDRPLPPTPNETPNTFLARELAETRQKLTARFMAAGGSGGHATDGQIDDMLCHLESLIAQSATNAASNKRIVSAPEPPTPDANCLPIITEEGRRTGSDEALNGTVIRRRAGPRAVTDLAANGYAPVIPPRWGGVPRDTIRVVDPSSPTPVAPLNIRKKSSVGPGAGAGGDTLRERGLKPQFLSGFDPSARDSWRVSKEVAPEVATRKESSKSAAGGATEKEAPVTKKRSWFKRKAELDDPQPQHAKNRTIWPEPERKMLFGMKPPQPQAQEQQAPGLFAPKVLRKKASRISDPPSIPSDPSTEFPMRENKEAPGAKKGLFDFFNRKAAKKLPGGGHHLQLGPTDFSADSLVNSYELPLDTQNSNPAIPADHTNWLARFLHLKPASRVLCFGVGRGGARAELVRLLRDWRRFGLRDVAFSRATNVVSARVDKANYLRIKPVTFAVELFAVLEHGRRASLSLARFTQTRGAASSFRKVVEVVEEVLREKGLLVEEEGKRRAMCEILG